MIKFYPVKMFRGGTIEYNGRIIETVEECAEIMNSMAKRLVEAQAKLPRWIPVSERLPKHTQKIVICTQFEELVAEFYMDRFTVVDSDGCHFDAGGVTHWMPLPERPEGE